MRGRGGVSPSLRLKKAVRKTRGHRRGCARSGGGGERGRGRGGRRGRVDDASDDVVRRAGGAASRREERFLASPRAVVRRRGGAHGVLQARGEGVVLSLALGVLRLGGSQDLSSELRLEMASLHLAPRLLRLALDRRELLAALELLHLSDGILHLQRVCVGTRGAVILEGEENETERRRGRSSDESGEGNDGTRKRREQGALPDFSGRTREARTMTTRRRIGRAIAVGRGREAGGAGCGASGGAGRPARVPAVPNAPSRERPSKGRAQTAFKSLRAIVSRERRDAETCVL